MDTIRQIEDENSFDSTKTSSLKHENNLSVLIAEPSLHVDILFAQWLVQQDTQDFIQKTIETTDPAAALEFRKDISDDLAELTDTVAKLAVEEVGERVLDLNILKEEKKENANVDAVKPQSIGQVSTEAAKKDSGINLGTDSTTFEEKEREFLKEIPTFYHPFGRPSPDDAPLPIINQVE